MLGVTLGPSERMSCVSPSCPLSSRPDTGLWGCTHDPPHHSPCTQESTLDHESGSPLLPTVPCNPEQIPPAGESCFCTTSACSVGCSKLLSLWPDFQGTRDGWNSVSSPSASQQTCARSLGEAPSSDTLGSRGLAQLQNNTLAVLGKGRGSAWLEVKRV